MPETGILEPHIIENIKQELYYLVRDHSKTYEITEFRRELFLHDSTRLNFKSSKITSLETFLSLMDRYWEYFPYIVSNLAFEYESKEIELSHKVIGSINVGKTLQVRTNQATKNIVCNISAKKLFLAENVLVGAVILGINLLAKWFQKKGSEGLEHYRQDHKKFLQSIINFTAFLLKDRNLKRLAEHYLAVYGSIDPLFPAIQRRLEQGRIRPRYKPMLSFIRQWKSYSWILNRTEDSLTSALTPHLENISEDRLYEMWIFYKILTQFEPIKQISKNFFVNEDKDISVEYHEQKTLDWQLEKNGKTFPIHRYPDVLIRVRKQAAAIIDAKCMTYHEAHEDDEQEPAPEHNIVNQLIMYLDHDKRCNLGFVLFADKAKRNDVVVSQGQRKIFFLNCYPFEDDNTSIFERIRKEVYGSHEVSSGSDKPHK